MIIPNQEKGVILSGSFERTSATLQQEFEEFSARLTQLKTRLRIDSFLVIEREEESRLLMFVIPAVSGGQTLEAAKERIMSTGDQMKLSGITSSQRSQSDLVRMIQEMQKQEP